MKNFKSSESVTTHLQKDKNFGTYCSNIFTCIDNKFIHLIKMYKKTQKDAYKNN